MPEHKILGFLVAEKYRFKKAYFLSEAFCSDGYHILGMPGGMVFRNVSSL